MIVAFGDGSVTIKRFRCPRSIVITSVFRKYSITSKRDQRVEFDGISRVAAVRRAIMTKQRAHWRILSRDGVSHA